MSTSKGHQTKQKCRNILELSREEKKKFIDSFDTIFSDCDGVVWLVTEPLPNIGPVVNLLKDEGKQIILVSNNSIRSDEEYLQKLSSMGVSGLEANDIVHPVKIILRYIKRHLHNQPLFSLSSPEVNMILRKNGVNIKTMVPKPINLPVKELAKCIMPDDTVAAVLFELGFDFTFGEMARAQQYLQNKDCKFITGGLDDYIPMTKGLTTFGIVPFINILKEYTGKEPIVLGKPGPLLGKDLIEHYKVKKPERALFIGDNLIMDIGFGRKSGFQTLLVLTGVTTYEHLMETPEEFMPDYYANGLSDFIAFFKSLNNQS